MKKKRSALQQAFFALPVIFFMLPASTNYQIHDVAFGGGFTSGATSAQYGLTAGAGEVSGTALESTTYSIGPGLTYTRQANVPAAPTVSNPGSYYDKLQVVLDTGSNPSDTTYAIAISSDNFLTTQYVKNDYAIGSTLAASDYLTYSGWGGASGFLVSGLTQSTTYQLKVKALHKGFTETGFSAAGSASTSATQLTFDLDVSAIDTETAPPYQLAFGTLSPGSTITSGQKVWVDIETNGTFGALVYIKGTNTGLRSVSAGNYLIPSLTADLAVVSEGFGTQVGTLAQSSGGPLVGSSPYNGLAQNVGIIDSTFREVLTSSAAITGGRASLLLKARTSALTPAGADYAEDITIVGAARF